MSQNKKKEVTSTLSPLNVFSIDLEESDEIPGVSQLLNPKAMAQKAAALTSVPSKSSPIILKDVGVLFEIKFCFQNGKHQFSEAIAHQATLPTQEWQSELWKDMNFSPEVLGVKNSFYEFAGQNHLFFLEIFGASEKQFVQIIRLETSTHTNEFTVLISIHSLISQKEAVIKACERNSFENTGTIELDMAS